MDLAPPLLPPATSLDWPRPLSDYVEMGLVAGPHFFCPAATIGAGPIKSPRKLT